MLFYLVYAGLPEEGLEWTDRFQSGYFRNVWRAMCLIRLGRTEEAIDSARELISEKPEFALSHLTLAQCLMVHGDYDGTEAAARKGWELAPRSSLPPFTLSYVSVQRGEFARAQELLENAVELEPGAVEANYYLGLTYLQTGQFLGAAELIQKAISLAGANARGRFAGPEPYLALGLALKEAGDQDGVNRAHARALELAKTHFLEDLRWLSTLLQVQMDLTLFGDCVRTLERMLERLPPGDPQEDSLRGMLEGSRQAALPDLPTFGSVDAAFEKAQRAPLAGEASSWRLHRGHSSPADGLQWTDVDFDDASWEAGKAGFGYADGDDATVLADMQGGYTTVYARSTFEVVSPDAIEALVVSVRADDGFIAFVNGQEVARKRVPADAVPPHDALATANAPEPAPVCEARIDARGLLRAGRNVFAVQGFNASLDSSDFSLVPSLWAETRQAAPGLDALASSFESVLKRTGDAPAMAIWLYLKGRIARKNRKEPDVESFFKSARAAPNRPEPAIRYAECLGSTREAAGVLARALRTSEYVPLELCTAWAELALGKLGMPAADALASLSAGARAGLAADMRWALDQLAGGGVLRINCGGPKVVDGEKRTWSRDRFYTSGTGFHGGRRIYRGQILGVRDDGAVFRTERHFDGSRPALEAAYRVPLPRGRYAVRFHFAEIHFTEPGKRVFDVLLEGKTCLEGFDPAIAGPATAQVKAFEAAVDDGVLEIGFRRRVQDPKISAIEIELLPAR